MLLIPALVYTEIFLKELFVHSCNTITHQKITQQLQMYPVKSDTESNFLFAEFFVCLVKEQQKTV